MSHENQFGLLHSVGASGSLVGVPLAGVSVEAEVHDFLCEVTVNQSYKNTNAFDIEAVYHFPLDEASAVCGFRAEYEDGVVVDAVVKEKTEARQEYQRAVRSGKQAQLLESVRPDIFTMTVGRMPAGSVLNIKVTYIALLKAEGSASRFLLPTHIAQRYSPSNKIAVTFPNVPSTFRPCIGLNVRVKFNTQSNIKQLTSPSHPHAFAASLNGKTGEVVFAEDMAMNTDLIVLCEEETPHQPRACVEIAKDGSLAGLVTLFPEIEFRDVPREIVFIIDRSGSMGFGRDHTGKTQMESAREALMLFLRALPASCTFNIIGFGSSHSSLFPTSQPYNDHTLNQATRYAASMASDMGGTEILKPLKHALSGSNKNMPRQVFVLTDGQVSNESAVFDCVRAGSAMGARTFCLGLGGGVSHHLVEGIARAGKGTAAFVTSGGDAEELHVKVLAQLKQALQPSLDNVSVRWNFPTSPPAPLVDVPAPSAPVKTLLGYRSPDVDKPAPPKAVVPRAFPTVAPPVFNRERFVSFALFPAGHTEVPTSVTISASTPDGPLDVELPITQEEVLSGDIAHRLAARVAICECEDSSNGSGAVSKAEALTFALNNSLASSQTSFVAVRTEPGDLSAMHRVVVPQAVAARELDEEALGRTRMMQQQLSVACSARQSNMQLCMAMATPVDQSELVSTVSWRVCSEPKTSEPKTWSPFSSLGLGGSRKKGMMKTMARSATLGAGGFACRGGSRGDTRGAAEAETASAFGGLFGGGGGGGGRGGGLMSRMFSSSDKADASLAKEAAAAAAPAMFNDCMEENCSDDDDELECDLDCAVAAPRARRLGDPPCRAACPPPPPAPAPRSHVRAAAPPPPKSGRAGAGGREKKSGGVFGLCLLQRANGSFVLDIELATILGASVAELQTTLEAILQRVSPQTVVDTSACGTLAALLAMRVLFSHQKSVYELQESKALAYLASRTADGKGFSSAQVEAGVAAITRVLVPSQGN